MDFDYMNDKELMNFVEWLSNNVESFSDLSIGEVISKINEMSTSDEGKQTLKQLTKQYKGMELFKKGGKLNYLLCLKNGGKGPDCGCNKKVIKAQPGAEMVAPGFDKRLELRHNQMMANGEMKDGGELPRYAKIIETRSPYAAERIMYYSDVDGDYEVKDGRIVSIEEGVPIAIGHNKLVRNAKQFGLNLPEIHEFKEPWYGQYREQPDGMDLVTAWQIDKKKAAKETSEKIKKIRSNQPGGTIDSNRLVTWTEPESKGGTYNAIYNDEQGNGKYAYTSYPGQGYSLKSGNKTYVSDGFTAFDVSDSTRYRPISEAPQDTLNWLRQIEQLRKQK